MGVTCQYQKMGVTLQHQKMGRGTPTSEDGRGTSTVTNTDEVKRRNIIMNIVRHYKRNNTLEVMQDAKRHTDKDKV